MISDYHMHTAFSEDSKAAPEAMIERAVSLGMKRICITDHMDIGFPQDAFWLDTPRYVERIRELQAQYQDRIDVRLGVELGLQVHVASILEGYVKRYPFDLSGKHLQDARTMKCSGIILNPHWKISGLFPGFMCLVIWTT